MNYINFQNQYKKTQIETATPGTLILMLYDGALKFLGQAREGLVKEDKELAHNNLIRVQAIVSELLTCLDMERGGEISKNLSRLYLFFLEQLTKANLDKDLAPLDQITPLLTDLRNTWAEAIKSENLEPVLPPQRKLNIAV